MARTFYVGFKRTLYLSLPEFSFSIPDYVQIQLGLQKKKCYRKKLMMVAIGKESG
ncbi:hypothetical protein JW887_06290 [Candidatus Dojkabacteria bacterium]|nr:hypothetical protein [Candidatus Dojkabacteria bacterium]